MDVLTSGTTELLSIGVGRDEGRSSILDCIENEWDGLTVKDGDSVSTGRDVR